MNKDKTYIFTPGPVKMPDYVLEEGAKQVPYFRTKSFSDVVLECERMLLQLLNAEEGSRVLFLAASGTGAMESVLVNTISKEDKAFIVNGGSFGQRFVDICELHKIKNVNHKLGYGKSLDLNSVVPKLNDVTTFIVNGHETSTGVLYDLASIGSLCRQKGIFFIVDAISMFLTDYIDMKSMGIDAVILSSQKGLALPPGLSILVLSKRAQKRVHDNFDKVKMVYLRLEDYLKDMERGQTPYTPPVGIILQLKKRLQMILNNGGLEKEIHRAKVVADYFRSNIHGLPIKIFSEALPNAMTSLTPTDGRSAQKIVLDLAEKYNIFVCPNGGEIKDTVFRVSHMGDTGKEDIDVLLNALKDYYSK